MPDEDLKIPDVIQEQIRKYSETYTRTYTEHTYPSGYKLTNTYVTYNYGIDLPSFSYGQRIEREHKEALLRLRRKVLLHDQNNMFVRFWMRCFSHIEHVRARLCHYQIKLFLASYNKNEGRVESIQALMDWDTSIAVSIPGSTQILTWRLSDQIKKISYWSRLRNGARSFLKFITDKLKTVNLADALIPSSVPPERPTSSEKRTVEVYLGNDPYKILGVPSTANQRAIIDAYRSLALKHHPDKGGDAEQFKRVADAYESAMDGAMPDPAPSTDKNRDEILRNQADREKIAKEIAAVKVVMEEDRRKAEADREEDRRKADAALEAARAEDRRKADAALEAARVEDRRKADAALEAARAEDRRKADAALEAARAEDRRKADAALEAARAEDRRRADAEMSSLRAMIEAIQRAQTGAAVALPAIAIAAAAAPAALDDADDAGAGRAPGFRR